jgi:Flp pilus assembly protein TadD
LNGQPINNSTNARELLERAHAARRSGAAQQALALFAEAAGAEPDNPEVQSVYGLMLLRSGRHAEAAAPLNRAVELAPGHPACNMNLAELEAAAGDIEAAARRVERVTGAAPDHWWAWERLGELRARQQRFADAETAFGKAVSLQPANPSLLYKWARAQFDCGRTDEAERTAREAYGRAPGNTAILSLLAAICDRRADWDTLERLARAWIAREAANPQPWRVLAKALRETARLHEALEAYRRALEAGSADAQDLATYGGMCLQALDFAAAATAFDQAEQLEPRCLAALAGRSILAMFRGQAGVEREYCERVLALDPEHVGSLKLLAQLNRGHPPPAVMQMLEQLAAREGLDPRERITANFALADCLDAGGDPERAFAAYATANGLAVTRAFSDSLAYDPRRREQEIDELIRLFAEPPADDLLCSRPRPLFVVGMPRSGTTLVEGILGAHSTVLACGERGELRWIMQQYLVRARRADPQLRSADSRLAWRREYLGTTLVSGGQAVITDKNPWNFDAVALIAWLFPDARIVHVRRDPLETCLSIWCNEFPKFVAFAHRFEDIAHYYAQYERLLAHWRSVLPGRFLELQYESLVAAYPQGVRRLLDYCGLEWQDACLEPPGEERTVATLSALQVRSPVASGIGRAARFSPYIAPLRAALRAAGVAAGGD